MLNVVVVLDYRSLDCEECR